MRLYELAYACRLYQSFSGFDESLKEFQQVTNGALNLDDTSQGQALMRWLNSWGCRQFAKTFHTMALKNLKEWAKTYLNRLPVAGSSLIGLPHATLNVITDAYGDLKRRPASIRGSRSVNFGATGAAKILFAIRPTICPPWDNLIRERLSYDGSPESYCRFLIHVQEELNVLNDEAAQFSIHSDEIPNEIGRPQSSLPKLVDEYNWVVYTRSCPPPTAKELERWLEWSRQGRRVA